MKKNMGITDRVIRTLIAAVVIILFVNHFISGTLGIVLLAVAGIFVLTSLVGLCPLYSLFGISTCRGKKA
ncbi:MAG: DUF2892 domain-containing protein [Bacteroidetes bacterium]|nr:DUF2892 domain-containing protein [Bacteroidota bacterium]